MSIKCSCGHDNLIGIKTDRGIYINTTGQEIDPTTIKPKTMRYMKCGKIYRNATLLTVPHPCECGGIGFETVKEQEAQDA